MGDAVLNWRKIRAEVYARDGGRCRECGVDLTGGRWDCAHREPHYQGGDATNTVENCRALCVACHRAESNREAGHRSAGKKTSVLTHLGQVIKPKKKRKWPSRKVQPHSKGLDAQRYGDGP